MNGRRGFLRHSLPSVSSWGGGYGYTNKHTNKQLYLRRVKHNSNSTDELVALDLQSTIIRSKMHLRIIKLVDRSIIIYIISSVMHAFWLVLSYDLLEDRCIDDVIVKTFFILYYIKQIDSKLPCVCSVIDHRGRQNVVRTSVTHSAAPHVPLFCSYHIFDG